MAKFAEVVTEATDEIVLLDERGQPEQDPLRQFMTALLTHKLPFWIKDQHRDGVPAPFGGMRGVGRDIPDVGDDAFHLVKLAVEEPSHERFNRIEGHDDLRGGVFMLEPIVGWLQVDIDAQAASHFEDVAVTGVIGWDIECWVGQSVGVRHDRC